MTGAFDLSVIIKLCTDSPSSLAVTDSYADASMPQYTFISMVNCQSDSQGRFLYYYGNDLTTGSISAFLKERTSSIHGARSFIIESATGYIIASKCLYTICFINIFTVDNDLEISGFDASGTLIRSTGLTVPDSSVVFLTTQILGENSNKWNSIQCNSIKVTSSPSDFIMYYRLCTELRIDWVIVLSVPQLNYTASIIIAVMAALVGSIIIVILGVVFGVFVSVRIVKPFYNLIELFESVAHMDLDKLEVRESGFSEVQQLQTHFTAMVSRMKLYKSFIPSHILNDLENAQNTEVVVRASFESSDKSHVSGVDNSLGSSKSSKLKGGSSKKKYAKDTDKFSLYLEYRKVTLLGIYLDGFNEWIRMIQPNETVHLLSDVFDIVNSICRSSGGYISSFDNDSIIIAFNATSNQANHEEKGANASRTLSDKLFGMKFMKWKNHDLCKKNPQLYESMNFRFALISQEGCCGNVGTTDFKNFTILSSGKSNLCRLIQVAKQMDVSIVCSESIHNLAQKSFQTRFISHQDITDESFISTAADELPLQKCRVYELGLSTQVVQDEVSCDVIFWITSNLVAVRVAATRENVQVECVQRGM